MARIRGAVTLLGLTLVGLVLLGHYRLDLSGATVQEATFNMLLGLRQNPENFPWDNIPTTKELKWRACYNSGLQCARLEVPLNYSDPEGRKASIALIRKPADVPTKSAFYRGPVLFNPGGPGGSGVDLIKGGADQLSILLGPQFDIVGFDPRGISRSTPTVSFFHTKAERAVWGVGGQGYRVGLANNTDGGVARTWARAVVVNKLAAETDDGYLRHINTENTARDMLRIVEAHGRTKIQYWGFSYGSVLGATFASLFPDRIERLIIDGVVDAENYYATLWSNDLLDTDKVMDSFYTGCADAGPEGCAFWAPTASDIEANLTKIINTVRASPVPMRTKAGYGLLDYAMLRFALFTSLYSPYASFPILAQALAELAGGDGTTLFDTMNPEAFQCNCEKVPKAESLPDAQTAVICNDGDDIPDDLVSAEKYFKAMMEASSWSEFMASIRLGCVNWPKFPKDHFQGPFKASTSHPILLIGNTADPVTPLWAAKKMSKGFKGSVVLTQDSAGHCSVSAPSVCTLQYVRDYFVDGTLPEPGTVCYSIGTPFPTNAEQDLLSTMTVEEQEIYAAALALSHDYGIIAPINMKGSKVETNGCTGM
ncbi:hypothetical protein D9619_008142 [Psilocybe cf. subviscida]|uniref:Peptidase S33 tripeptidyl aminopeptidase-like C-terminal domain-containing protein n=1 Tax=Psilocybe cf. subviscida TaxID=2480587 RepID=A0A8H5AUL1_9AGAR|nr:hypothetical protein D9619_008142 [Psilocybe cf. subviscida]